jgi:hypothetical protein
VHLLQLSHEPASVITAVISTIKCEIPLLFYCHNGFNNYFNLNTFVVQNKILISTDVILYD